MPGKMGKKKKMMGKKSMAMKPMGKRRRTLTGKKMGKKMMKKKY